MKRYWLLVRGSCDDGEDPIRIALDGALTSRTTGLPAGEHEGDIVVIESDLANTALAELFACCLAPAAKGERAGQSDDSARALTR